LETNSKITTEIHRCLVEPRWGREGGRFPKAKLEEFIFKVFARFGLNVDAEEEKWQIFLCDFDDLVSEEDIRDKICEFLKRRVQATTFGTQDHRVVSDFKFNWNVKYDAGLNKFLSYSRNSRKAKNININEILREHMKTFDARQSTYNLFKSTLITMAICHDVKIVKPSQANPGSLLKTPSNTISNQNKKDVRNENNQLDKYFGNSHEELSMINFAKNVGLEFVNLDKKIFTLKNTLDVSEDEAGRTETYEFLGKIPFTHERRRMTVIVKMPETHRNQPTLGKGQQIEIKAFMKGSDDAVIARTARNLGQEVADDCERRIKELKAQGYKVIAFAERWITPSDWDNFWPCMNEETIDRFEQKFKLTGCAFFKETLNPHVEETVAQIKKAGIQFWVLSGDGIDACRHIGYACGMFDRKPTHEDFQNKHCEVIEIAYKDDLTKDTKELTRILEKKFLAHQKDK
jgi:magnesium-transporting ATPase (P-type)